MTPTETGQLDRGPARFRAPEQAQPRRSVGAALGAGLALLVLLVGVPVGLWLLSGPPPYPSGLPTREDLTAPLDVEALLVVMRLVVWLAWLQFAVCVVVEAASAVRGHGLPRAVPLSGFSQQLARGLVGALLVGGVLAGSSSGAVAASMPTQDAGAPAATAVQLDRADAGSAHAGGGEQVRDAHEAAPEGAAEQRLRPAHAGVPEDMTDVVGKKVYVVQPPKGHYHDNLWDIAERHLGDGRRWQEIYDLNDRREQPDGKQLVLGRLIQPGWVLVMPENATGVDRVEAAPAPSAAVHDAVPAPGEAPAATEGGAVPDMPETGSGISAEPGGLPRDLLLGGLLSAGVLGALAAERRRRRGSTPDPEALEAEVALRVGADEDRAARLDRALRGLSATCRAGQTALPPVFAAAVDDDVIDLRLAPGRPDAPAPWTPVDEGRVWRLHRDAGDGAGPSGLGHAPFPGLVCVGRDLEGRDVLVDLESVGGVVSVTGDDHVAAEVVSALAVQLATNAWTDLQQVTGHGLAPVLADLAGDRLRLVGDVEPLLAEVSRSAPGRAAGDVLTGRLARRPGVVPAYLALGSAPSAELAERLVGLTASGSRGFGVVSVGAVAGTRWQLEVDESGTLTIPLLDVRVEAVRLTARSAGQVAELFGRARTEQPAPEGRVALTAPPRSGDDAHWSTAPVRVGVLGPVETRTLGTLDPTRVALATEVVTFLALQNAPVHPSVLAASVWPRGVTPEVRDATVDRVREWLGTDPDGNHHLRVDADGRLLLGPGVAVDWAALCELAIRARRAASPREEGELLRRALHLVRGELLADRPAGRYAWLARTNLETHVPDVVADAAHRLVELCRQDGDPAGAAAAARAGLRMAPGAQLLWRDLLRSELDRAGDAAAAEAAGEMADVLAARGAHVEAETDALVDELLPTERAASS